MKRTPGISTTDLVGRMLLCTKNHFIKSLERVLSGEEGPGSATERKQVGKEMKQRIRDYASDKSGLLPGPVVMSWNTLDSPAQADQSVASGFFSTMVDGTPPRPGQRIIYVDGGFDLFSSGHIEFLQKVAEREDELGSTSGWFEKLASDVRIEKAGEDYGPAFLIAGIHDDGIINSWKGLNYPIMNIFERGLCVLQCRVSALSPNALFMILLILSAKYINSIIFSAPFTPAKAYLAQMPFGIPDVVYHGPTSFIPLPYDPYVDAKKMNIYQDIGKHEYQDVNAGEIVQRILRSKEMYENRQRIKGLKAPGEEAVQRREEMERAAAGGERERAPPRT